MISNVGLRDSHVPCVCDFSCPILRVTTNENRDLYRITVPGHIDLAMLGMKGNLCFHGNRVI